jgi:hypothetical protein
VGRAMGRGDWRCETNIKRGEEKKIKGQVWTQRAGSWQLAGRPATEWVKFMGS